MEGHQEEDEAALISRSVAATPQEEAALLTRRRGRASCGSLVKRRLQPRGVLARLGELRAARLEERVEGCDAAVEADDLGAHTHQGVGRVRVRAHLALEVARRADERALRVVELLARGRVRACLHGEA